MADAIWGRILRNNRRRRDEQRHWLFVFFDAVGTLRWGIVAVLLVVGGLALYGEIRTSFVQSWVFSRLARNMTFRVAPGVGSDIHFPKYGPYDERVGYAELPEFIHSLSGHDFVVTRQARWSPLLSDFVGEGGYAIYHEKPQSGLRIYGRDGKPLYSVRYPGRIFSNFAAVPPLIFESLLFIEDHHLLDADKPYRDPAIQWDRFMLAAAGRVAGAFDKKLRQGGASTLATQIEKFEHSPGGRTDSIGEKLRQMLSASLNAYRDGRKTLKARRHILVHYLNAEPFGSWPGYGEVIGIPDAMWIWYGRDLPEVESALREPAATPAALRRKAVIYREALSLLLAGRRPAYFLNQSRSALEDLTDQYLHMLAAAKVITPRLERAALRARLNFRRALPPPPPPSYVRNKATDWLRDELVSLLHVGNYYNLDHLDLTAHSTIDAAAQRRITDVLARLGDPGYDRSLGLYGNQLLGAASPARIDWSVVLYEKGANANFVRIDSQSLDEPFDINSGAKMQLGSTAKLRTLITYLDIIGRLHHRLGGMTRTALLATAKQARADDDALTQWAAGYLAANRGISLQNMLDAAMQRTYSASPAPFFTDGGVEVFANFKKFEDYERPTVTVAFQNSINNSFIRIMRDIVHFYIAQGGERTQKLLHDPNDPERLVYLRRFANQEGQVFLDRFYKEYSKLNPEAAVYKLARNAGLSPKRLAVVFRSIYPNARIAQMRAFIAHFLPRTTISDDDLWDMYRQASIHLFSLEDRAYIGRVHPLALWLVHYLRKHPGASRAQVIAASAKVRQEVYGWLFKSRSAFIQTVRIRELLDEDAFRHILKDWRRQGYPFNYLVPSYATAIGVSGDRPDALAGLMGIIMHDGVRVPTVDLRRLDFGVGTPYETDLKDRPAPQRVLSPQVAATVRKTLLTVVQGGTGIGVRNVYRAPDGSLLPVGGKTGTGDNRFHIWARGGRLIGERVVDRTATFVFYIGNRFYGTITAYVPGAVAGRYKFTSALAVHLLKAIEPQLRPLIDGPPPAQPSATTARQTVRPPPPSQQVRGRLQPADFTAR